MEKISLAVEQRDVLLVPFPFSDFSGSKIRPVLVISNSSFNHLSNDVIVCGITTNMIRDYYSIPIANKDLEQGKLYSACCIKVESILRVDKRIIIKKIGKLKEDVFVKIMGKLRSLF